MTDWRDGLLGRLTPISGIEPRAGDAVRAGVATLAGPRGDLPAVVAAWDFTVHGGSFGAREATVFAAACDHAAATRTPLVTLLRSGGTRLQEGMHALVGIPRAVLALDRVAAAGVAHLSVADQPTTGGVWVAIGAVADLRAGVRGATVGFSGPRVIEAMTGTALAAGAHTAESAAAAGLLDAVLDPGEVPAWLARALAALRPDEPEPVEPPGEVAVPARAAWDQVLASRQAARASGADLLRAVATGTVALRAADGTVAAAVGRIAGRRSVVAALAGHRHEHPTPAGYALLARAADLADRLDLSLVVLVDTPGADPLPPSEDAGLASAITAGMRAVLGCRAPTVAVVHGEGGSGGALAGAVTDLVGVTEYGWFAALGPEGAGAALRRDPADAAAAMRVTPADLLASGFADAMAPTGAAPLRAWLASHLDALRARPRESRLRARGDRWSSGLPPSPDQG